jgi:hypothetical protein
MHQYASIRNVQTAELAQRERHKAFIAFSLNVIRRIPHQAALCFAQARIYSGGNLQTVTLAAVISHRLVLAIS